MRMPACWLADFAFVSLSPDECGSEYTMKKTGDFWIGRLPEGGRQTDQRGARSGA